MKAVHKLAAGLAVAGLAATAAIAARPMPVKVSPRADGTTGGIAAAAAGFNYATDFEATGAPGGYNTTGYINNGAGVFPAGCGGVAVPCWGHTTGAGFSLITPTIDTNFPAGGTQHLRLTGDPSTRTNITNFGLGVDARFPRTADLSARPIAPNTVSHDLSISNPNGQDYRVQPQSNSMGSLATSALFFYSGAIYILDDVCGSVGLNFQPTGVFWDTTGAYQNYTVGNNPCADTTTYLYGGAPLYSSCVPAGTNLEQYLIFGDNYPGSEARVDNLVMSSLELCPATCGNGIVEGPGETCDGAADANCPGRCIGVGLPGECTCTPICTQAAPCPVNNGANGPFIASSGFYTYVGNSPFVSIDSCGSDFDSFIDVTGGGTGYNDNCNEGQFGADNDSSASCYDTVTNANAYPSCLCVANDGSGLSIEIGSFGFLPGQSSPTSTMVNVRKKSVCEGASVGACCDTNGMDFGCTDNVTQSACTGADKVWTNQGKCVDVQCACIPDCTGRTCGDDGCGGSCGVCGDGNVCNGDEVCNANGTCDAGQPLVCNDGNACNGVETCDSVAGCRPGQPLVCDNGLACDGVESCNPSSGCVSGTAVSCDDGQDCSVDTCNEPDGSCSHDTSGCSIPTVSEWGLVVLTLMLLIGAKVYFGRRQAIA